MIKPLRALGATTLSVLAPSAWACDAPDERFAEWLNFSSVAFIGTVVGYRLDDTKLATDVPDCPYGGNEDLASDLCLEFWTKVVSIQFDVETPIKGIAGDRKYEIEVINRDGCAPMVGARWLTDGWYSSGFSMVLESPPTQEQIDEWRVIATAEHN